MHSIGNYLQRPLQISTEIFLRAACTPIRPGIEGNWSNPTAEKVSRCASIFLNAILAPLTASLYILGEGVHLLGYAISRKPYIYWKGEGKEKQDDKKLKCMTLNTCMFWGGLPYVLGGLRPAGERTEDLAKLIRKQNPDLLFLQEVSHPAARELFEKLKREYAHCYTRIGPNPLRMESGLSLFSKVAIQNPTFLPFPNQTGIKRGAFFIDTPSYTFITTHLEAGNATEKRKAQLELLSEQIASIQKKEDKKVFIFGDLNIDSHNSVNDEYDSTIGSSDFYNPLEDDKMETATTGLENYMRGKEGAAHSMTLDYALLSGKPDGLKLKTELIDTYSLEEPYQALSDHKALVLVLEIS